MATDLETSVASLVVSTNIISDVINEDASTEVPTDSGPIPSLRKALADNLYFLDPIPWNNGTNETVFNQLRTFTDGTVWWAPSATNVNPVPMGVTPEGDSNWYPWQDQNLKNNIIEEVTRFNIVGTFTDGFTYNNVDDVGIDTSGNPWTYTGSLPFTVPPATVPSEPSYQQEDFSSINSLSDVENVNLINLTLRRNVTLAEAIADNTDQIGTLYTLTDNSNAHYEVVSSSDTGGFYIATLANGNKLKYVAGMVIDVRHFGAKNGQDSTIAFDGFYLTLKNLVTNFGTAGSTVGQPENLGRGVTGYLGLGESYIYNGDLEIYPWIETMGNGSVIDLTNASSIKISPVFTKFNRVSFVTSVKREGIVFTDFPSQIQTDAPSVTFEMCIFKGFSDAMNTTATANPRSLRLVQCRSVACHQFSSDLEFDNAEIIGGSYTPEFSALDAPYIDNKGSLQVSGTLFIPVDDLQYNPSPPTTVPRTHYRYFDNYRNLVIDDNTRFGNELVNRAGIENSDIDTPQVTICYNYADISETSTLRAGSQLNANLINNSLIIKDSIVFARHTAVVQLFGLPATLIIRGNTGVPEAIFETGSTSVIDLDRTRTISSSGGLFYIDPALRTRLESNNLELQRVSNVDVDIHRLYTPIVVSSASILEPLIMQLRRDENGTPKLLIPRTQTTTNSDFFFLSDLLPTSLVFEIHMTSFKGSVISKAGYRVVKRIFDNAGTTTSQLLATQLYTQDWSGGITLGHENVTTDTSTNLNPKFIGVRFTDMSTTKLNNRVELKFLSL